MRNTTKEKPIPYPSSESIIEAIHVINAAKKKDAETRIQADSLNVRSQYLYKQRLTYNKTGAIIPPPKWGQMDEVKCAGPNHRRKAHLMTTNNPLDEW